MSSFWDKVKVAAHSTVVRLTPGAQPQQRRRPPHPVQRLGALGSTPLVSFVPATPHPAAVTYAQPSGPVAQTSTATSSPFPPMTVNRAPTGSTRDALAQRAFTTPNNAQGARLPQGASHKGYPGLGTVGAEGNLRNGVSITYERDQAVFLGARGIPFQGQAAPYKGAIRFK